MNDSWKVIRQEFSKARGDGAARHRDIARALGVSEGELIAAHAGSFDAAESPLKARRLQHDWPDIVASLESLGEVMALTRNESCVHEKTGTYRQASTSGHVGLVLGREIDLRLFYSQWAHGFAVDERHPDGSMQRSLQFFDAHGAAVHKVFMRESSDIEAYRGLVERFGTQQLCCGIAVVAGRLVPVERPDDAIDVPGFREAWSSMRDTHEFFGLLRRFGVSRTQGLRLAPPEFAQRVDASSAQEVLSRAAQDGVSIMVFVGNPGTIQIHTGPVRRVVVTGPWLNVLDAGFNLHLREDHVASAWLVRKPTADGLVHSLELFDATGQTIAMLFGERKPGHAERCDWRNLLATLSPEVEPCVA